MAYEDYKRLAAKHTRLNARSADRWKHNVTNGLFLEPSKVTFVWYDTTVENSAARSFGQWLHQQRRTRGLTQDQLAARAGLRRPHISRLENDEARPRRTTVRALAAALGIAAPAEIARAEALAGHISASVGALPVDRLRQVLESLADDSVGQEVLARIAEVLRASGGAPDSLRPDDEVSRINAAYRYARFTLRATGGGYDLEIRPPADDLDREGLDDRLAFVRTIEDHHGLKLLPDDIG